MRGADKILAPGVSLCRGARTSRHRPPQLGALAPTWPHKNGVTHAGRGCSALFLVDGTFAG